MYNVLIVDDEPRICAGLRVFIDWESIGFRVLNTAENGLEALAELKKNRYNVVITDIRMAMVDGLELTRAIYAQNPGVRVLIISGYNDFEYAKEAIAYGVRGYLLKPVNCDELLRAVLKIKDELDRENDNLLKNREINYLSRDKFLFDLAYGVLSQKDIEVKLREFGINFTAKLFSLGLIEMEEFFHIAQADAEEANLIKFSVRNIAEEIITENNLGYIYEDINGRLGILLCAEMQGFSEDRTSCCLNNICVCIDKYLHRNINIAYGNFTSEVSGIRTSRRQAQMALDSIMLEGRKRVVPYRRIMLEEKSVLDLEWSNEALIAFIEIADKKKVEGEVDRLTGEVASKCFSKEALNGIAYNIILKTCTVVKSYNGHANELFASMGVNAGRLDFPNLQKYREWLLMLCLGTCDYILELQERKSISIFNQIRKYIDDNYYKDLSLKSLSEVFYMNSAYLGRLFKNNMGESFNDYLNKVRISEVKKILFQENAKIYNLITRVGYSNHEHFYRQFKRYEGISFADYKQRLKANLHN